MLKIQRKKKNDKEFIIFQDGNYVYTKDETSLKDINIDENSNVKKVKNSTFNIKKLKDELKSATDLSNKGQILSANLKGTKLLKSIIAIPCICLVLYVGADLYQSFMLNNPLKISQSVQSESNTNTITDSSTKDDTTTKNEEPIITTENKTFKNTSAANETSNKDSKDNNSLNYLINEDTLLITDITTESDLVQSYINNDANFATLISREKSHLSNHQKKLQELQDNESAFNNNGLTEFYKCLKQRYENSIGLTTTVLSDLSNSSGRVVIENHLNLYIQKEVDFKKNQNEVFLQTLDNLNIKYSKDEVTGTITFK